MHCQVLEPVEVKKCISLNFSCNYSLKNQERTWFIPTPTTQTSLKSKVMRYFLIALTICGCGLGQAAPSNRPNDDIEKFLSDRGLFEQLDNLRQNVGEKASKLVVNAMGFLGVPYRAGGTNINTGFDCSGFVRAIFEQSVGLILPRKASDQAKVTESIERTELKPGDLVFFNTMKHAFSHVGIYVGDNKFIHSPRPGYGVRVEDMRQAYWERRYNGARRVKDLGKNPLNALPSLLGLPSANAGNNGASPNAMELNAAPLAPSTGFYNSGNNEPGPGLFWDKSTATGTNPSIAPTVSSAGPGAPLSNSGK